MVGKAPGEITHNQADGDQANTDVPPEIPAPGSDTNSEKNTQSSQQNSDRKHRDCFDWVSLIVMVMTFAAAGGAAYEAKRLADGTDVLVEDARKTSERQLRAYVGIAADGLKISCPDCISEGRPYHAAILGQALVDITSARAIAKDAYFRGAVIYHDIFDNERWSNFCFQYVQGGSSEGFIGCATHAAEDK
jgi:hypothetical protein